MSLTMRERLTGERTNNVQKKGERLNLEEMQALR